MKNPTNARAYVKLQPTENNIGGIVEEHTRFWRKYDDEEEAKEKARKAREQEALAEKNKDFFNLYSAFNPEETTSYFNSQVMDFAENRRPLWKDLARKAADGDYNARLKLTDEKNKLDNLVSMSKSFGEKRSALEKQKSEGVFNKELDGDADDFFSNILGGKFKINRDGNFTVFDPSGEELKTISSSQLRASPYMNWNYSKEANFDENGLAVAEKILDTEDGSKEIKDPVKIRNRGVANVKTLLNSDSIDQRTFYKKYNRERGIKNPKPFKDLDDAESTAVAGAYYDQNVEKYIRQITKTEDNRLEEEKIRTQKARTASIYAGINNSSEKASTVTVVANEDGSIPTFNNLKKDEIISFSLPKPIYYGSSSNSKGVKVEGYDITPKGKIRFYGFATLKPIQGDDTESTEEELNELNPVTNQKIYIDNLTEKNNIASRIPNGEGKKTTFDNVSDLFDKSEKLLSKQRSEFNKKNKTSSKRGTVR